ncbi:hypothetical protein HYH02_005657 [Chlamydomonas schloesseri]|uniref:Uncharacterized protein n=1 Tax=Chlamydomonas schloesseri TaxID=2026947 RepID=A0A836B778_9CHLO|nr:hypothetical protein HYH02_005657 [Chlamydomonas schloesseri]|eukprot:KAG2449513.1 hypothetical protein HYH02_005657 [Chlamydomonas schloesseri]
MGLRELVLGGPLGRKDALGAKCARIDSLGLARRRLAKGKEEELVIEEPGPDNEAPAASAEEVVLKSGDDAPLQPSEDGDVDSEAELKTPLANRHLNDSLRLARRRLRASIDIGATARSGAGLSNLANPGLQRASWSSSGTPHAAANEHTAGAAGAAPSSSRAHNGRQRSSSPSHHRGAASHHVRFRRASDGEYLNRRRKVSDSSRAPGAVGAAAAAVGRLFRKLTANLGAESTGHRPRSATPSRGGSPARSRRSSGHGPAGGSSTHGDRDRAQSVSSQRRRRSSDTGMDPSSPPPAASSSASASASTSSRRNKRASAPGEMIFSVGGGAGAAEAQSPPLGTRPGSAVAAARDSITKGKNWLARLSRGLTTGSGGSSGAAGGAGGTPPRPATAHPAGGGGGGAVSSPLPPLPAGAAPAEAPKSPHHHSGPVIRAFGLFARRSDPPAPAPAAAGCPDSGHAPKDSPRHTVRSGPASAAAAAALADGGDDEDLNAPAVPAPERAPAAAVADSVPAPAAPVDDVPAPASVPLRAVA